MISKLKRSKYMWNFTFGVEDSLVSTVGLVSGIAAAGVGSHEVILTGAVLVFVEAISMGMGSFLTDQSVEEYRKQKEVPAGNSVPGAVVMFISYFFSGLIPLIPYIVLPLSLAFNMSILVTLISLFVLGLVNGKSAGVNVIKEGLRMAGFGGLAIAGGVVVGKLLR